MFSAVLLNSVSLSATNSYIRGTNGNSNGIVPMLRVFNDTARYVDQVQIGFVIIDKSKC